MNALIKGFLVSGSLVVAIGTQNAFVLKHGILKNNITAIVAICFLCDFILISIGVFGLGDLIQQSKIFSILLAGFGAVFLFFYGARSFYQSFRSSEALNINTQTSQEKNTSSIILATLAVTLINPHVYLDTVVIVGGIAGTMPLNEKLLFLTGSLSSSLLWFCCLGYGARVLTPLFGNPKSWRILEFVIACIMWLIASQLIIFLISVILGHHTPHS
ncbi:LysE/ArgO family amino acid transporter [Comamonas composti]|uniref:LysE/ArgO family amino acid transporter n=1 Tax=Comamonas composti TaxID=408558 RepID=UPI000A01CBAC|nr:LysE/ArgO family amino acid transporter [Comamonas composti]